MNRYTQPLWILLLFVALPLISFGQGNEDDLGIFDQWTDVGKTGVAGGAFYQSSEQAYYLKAAGENIWGTLDSFGFLWKRVSGDVSMEGSVTIVDLTEAPHRKAGWMIRASLEPDAPHVTCAVHGDGLVSMQYRPSSGAETKGIPFEVKGADKIRLEKKGTVFTMSAAKSGEEYETKTVELRGIEGPLLAGPWVCSKNVEQLEAARFGYVRLVVP